MRKTRFTQWIVLVSIGAIAGCTSSGDGTLGNTELNVIVPNGATPSPLPTPDGNNGSSAPALIDIQSVEYTINCLGTAASFLDNNTPLPNDGAVTVNGNLEVVDGRTNFTCGGVNGGQTCAVDADCTAPTTCDPVVGDFGPGGQIPGGPLPGGQAEIWQGFMDLPPGDCTVELRARDGDGEVICSARESFVITVDTVAKVNLVLICDISFQAPVGSLDVDATFSFVVGNFCPDLIVINCNPQDEPVGVIQTVIGPQAPAGCQVRARDVDSTCGTSCDPQDCQPDGLAGFICTNPPPPATGLNTTVTCTSTVVPIPGIPVCVMDCEVDGQPNFVPTGVQCPLGTECGVAELCSVDAGGPGVNLCVISQCSFDGDVLGTLGQGPPAFNDPGDGGWVVAYALCSQDIITATGGALPQCNQAGQIGNPLYSGADCTCVATTNDGDDDCEKTKQVTLTGPGDSACTVAGCVAGQDCAFCDDGNDCTSDVCDDSTGPALCPNDPTPQGTSCSDFFPAGGVCDGSGNCGITGCNQDSDCAPAEPLNCLAAQTCDVPNNVCEAALPGNVGGTCNSGTGSGQGTCDAAGNCNSDDQCTTATQAADCGVNANECLLNQCNEGVTPFACETVDNDGASCNAGAGVCSGGTCVIPPQMSPTNGSTTWSAQTGQGNTPDGCQVFVTVISNDIFLDVDITLDVAATNTDITTSYTVSATNPLLPTLGNAAEYGGLTLPTDFVNGNPAGAVNNGNPAAFGQFIGVFLTGSTLNLVTPGEILPTTTGVIPTTLPGSNVEANWTGTFSLQLDLAGMPLVTVDESVCTFNVQGAPILIPVIP